MTPEEHYLSGLRKNPSWDDTILRGLDQAPRTGTRQRISFIDRSRRGSTEPADLDTLFKLVEDSKVERVCVCENVDATMIGALGAQWNIDHEFFIAHARKPDMGDLWQAITHAALKPSRSTHLNVKHHVIGGLATSCFGDHMEDPREGVPFHYIHRECSDWLPDREWGMETRASYYRVSERFCTSTGNENTTEEFD